MLDRVPVAAEDDARDELVLVAVVDVVVDDDTRLLLDVLEVETDDPDELVAEVEVPVAGVEEEAVVESGT